MYYGPGSRELQGIGKLWSVYLPAGEWYDYWSDERTQGSLTIEAKADLETLPLFVRAGSIVPLGPDVQYADEQPEAMIGLKVYSGKDASFTLYEDEGDNYNYENGSYSLIKMEWCEAERTLTIGKRSGSYAGMPEARQFAVEIAGIAGKCIVFYQGEPVAVREEDLKS
ncbi:putative alpha-glucosidase [compost metagenome]